jgi:hypothetical protein
MQARTIEASKEPSQQESSQQKSSLIENRLINASCEVKKLAFGEDYWTLKDNMHKHLSGHIRNSDFSKPPLDYSGIIFNIKLIYDACESHSKIINALHRSINEGIDEEYNIEVEGQIYTFPLLPMGILSTQSISCKFGTFDLEIPDNTFKFDRLEGRNQLEILIDLPSRNSDLLLQKLSVVGDAIKVLQNNGVEIDFDLATAIKKIDAEYSLNNLSDCACAATIKQLITLLSMNENMACDDAIYLSYCFNALKSFDHSLFSKPHSLAELNSELFSVIDKLFSTPFKKQTANPSLENQNDKENKTLALNNPLSNEINLFLQRINICQRIKLYSPCLGKLAFDGGLYTWNYTEYEFLQDTAYKPNEKAELCIEICPENSKDYNQHYAPGKNNHGFFDRELLAWAPHANLSFSEKTEWHKTIIFSAESSQRLLAMQLHFNVDNIKALLKARNNYGLFQQASRSGNLRNLVHDIVKAIFTLALGPMYSEQELNAPLNQRNVLTYKPR